MKLAVKNLHRISYKEAWDLQKEMVEKRKDYLIPDTLLLCEHDPVYTLGKSADRNNLLVNPTFLKNIGAEVFEIERGGDITYHGPGQLVGYPILDLNKLGIGVRKYVDILEEALIRTLQKFNIETERVEGLTGIWLTSGPPRKIAAIGIKISRGITMHGFALNVSTDLTYFNHIIPCGIQDKGVTTMEKELGRKVTLEEVAEAFAWELESRLLDG